MPRYGLWSLWRSPRSDALAKSRQGDPLLLSAGQRSALQGVIATYFASRDVAYLTREVRRFVTALLSQKSPHRHPPATARLRPSRMKQLTLCEAPASYKRKGSIMKRRT
jgi:hypothetical protein